MTVERTRQMKWFRKLCDWFGPPICVAFALIAILGLAFVHCDTAQAQCRNGVCYLQPSGPTIQPVYLPPVYVIQHKQPSDHQPASGDPDQPAQPTPSPPVLIPVPDPAFSQCGPHGCHRPVMMPVYRCGPTGCSPPPWCGAPPSVHSFATRRTVGVGVEFSWRSAGSRRW